MVRRIDNEGTTVWTATFGSSQESVGFSIAQVTYWVTRQDVAKEMERN